jgi:hypothetical protein
MSKKQKCPKRKADWGLPRLEVHVNMGGYYRVIAHGRDDLRDGDANYAVLELGRGATKEEALAEADAWFAGMRGR